MKEGHFLQLYPSSFTAPPLSSSMSAYSPPFFHSFYFSSYLSFHLSFVLSFTFISLPFLFFSLFFYVFIFLFLSIFLSSASLFHDISLAFILYLLFSFFGSFFSPYELIAVSVNKVSLKIQNNSFFLSLSLSFSFLFLCLSCCME